MKKTIFYLIILTLTPIYSFSQWYGKFYNDHEEIVLWKNLQYVSDQVAYCSNQNDKIFKTNDNWKTYEVINFKLPFGHSIEYLYFHGKNKGLLVLKNNYDSRNHSGLIMITENGGYKWNIVFEIPPIIQHNRIGSGNENFYCNVKENGLVAVLFGNIISTGQLNGENWRYESTPWQRDNVNVGFYFLGKDKYIIFNYDLDRIKIGDAWTSEVPSDPLSLGDGFKYVWDDGIKEYDFNNKTWQDLIYKDDLNPNRVKQLSNNLAIIKHYDWRVSNDQYTIFNYKLKKFFNLYSSDTLFNSNIICNHDSIFIVMYEHNYFKSNNYGLTWTSFSLGNNKDIYAYYSQSAFNERIQMFSSLYGQLFFSVDLGENWKKVDEKQLYKYFKIDSGLYPDIKFSYSNNSEIYIKHNDSVFKINPYLDSFNIEKSQLNSINKAIAEVLHTYQNEIYVLVYDSFKDRISYFSLYEFKSNQFYKLTSFNLETYNSIHAKMIKKNKNLILTVGNNVYLYDIERNDFQKINYSLISDIDNVEIIEDSLILASSYNDYLLYNLKLNKKEDLFLQDSNISNYGTIYKSNNEFYIYGERFINICKNNSTPKLDESFSFLDYLYGAKNWNNQTWLFGALNLYTNKISNNSNLKEECINKLQLYPNPNQGIFNIYYFTPIYQSLEYSIYNEIGQLILSKNILNYIGEYEVKFDIQNLKNGLYFIKFKSQCETKVFKIIKNSQ